MSCGSRLLTALDILQVNDDKITTYAVVETIIKPSSKERECSYAELLEAEQVLLITRLQGKRPGLSKTPPARFAEKTQCQHAFPLRPDFRACPEPSHSRCPS